MPIPDYIEQFPLPLDQIPVGLKEVLVPESATNPQREVIVTHRYEHNKYKDNYEYLHMIMATVPQEDVHALEVLRESADGVVVTSTPDCRVKGGVRDYNISVSGYGYIVASWGGSSHFSFMLAEDVWMTLGLKPRLIGESEQKVIFDEVSLPDHGVAQGDVSSEYYFGSSKDIKWTMRNDYLRQYLWMKDYVGVRVFFYETYIDRTPEVTELLAGTVHYKLENSWIELDIVDHGDRVMMQVWGTVQSVQPELCAHLDIDKLIWPGHEEPMTKARASDFTKNEYVYIDDSFLDKYEKDGTYDAIPYFDGSKYRADPSYGGQWGFRDCVRVGRNLIHMPFYELYRGVPDREIYHVFDYAKETSLIEQSELAGEHIVSKTFRFAEELGRLNKNLNALASTVGVTLSESEIVVAH